METTSAIAASSSSSPMPGSASPVGPAPGPVMVGADGKNLGPTYVNSKTETPSASPQELQKKFRADRAARVDKINTQLRGEGEAEEAPAEGEEAVEVGDEGTVEATPEEALAAEQEGPSEGKDVTGEKSRIERVQEAVRRSKAAASKNRQLVKEMARRDVEAQGMRQRMQALEAQAQRGADFERSVMADPLKALEQRGVTADAIAQRVLMAGTPEEKIEALKAQVEAQARRADALEKQAASEKAAIKFQSDLKHAEDVFVKLSSNTDAYPNLQGHPRQALLAMAKQVAQEAKQRYIRETGVSPTITDKQILVYLNKLYAKSASSKEAPAAAKTKAATATPSKAAKPSGTASPKPASPRTLTSGQSAGSFVRPPNWDSLSRIQRAQLLRQDVSRRS